MTECKVKACNCHFQKLERDNHLSILKNLDWDSLENYQLKEIVNYLNKIVFGGN